MNAIYKGLTHYYYTLNENTFLEYGSNGFDWNRFEKNDKEVSDWEKEFKKLF